MQRLRNILIGTSAYSLFEDVNLERVPLMRDGFCDFHYGQFSTEYLKYAAGESTIDILTKYNLLNRFGVEVWVVAKSTSGRESDFRWGRYLYRYLFMVSVYVPLRLPTGPRRARKVLERSFSCWFLASH